jgi:hypothetical protein
MQKMQFPIGSERSALTSVQPDSVSLRPWLDAMRRSLQTDSGLCWAISAILFCLCAWPLVLTDVPPYQDLPNHLAAAHILWHAERYPEFVANGFLKTNAALFTWLYFVGKVTSLSAAARLFSALTLLVGAIAYPRFMLAFGGRKRMIAASFFLWPMVHNWFVSKGMLDFALGVPLSLLLLVLLRAQRETPTRAREGLIVLLSLATWYAHVFSLLVVGFLAAVHLVESRTTRLLDIRRLAPAMLPASALTAFSVLRHWTEKAGAMCGFINIHELSPPLEILYNLWAEWCAGFTWLSSASLLPIIAGVWGIVRWRRASPVFFSPLALVALTVLYVLLPYTTTNWFHVSSRVIPYIWMALLLRLPDRLPKLVTSVCAMGALSYSIAMGVDFVRLDADRRAFTAGIEAVPEGARLLPLVFQPKETSENTRSLMHAWGHYVVERSTSAPLLFAHSRSFPVMYSDPPPPRFNHLVLENFASTMGNERWMCELERSFGVVTNDCTAEWNKRWNEFWKEANPRFDHVLMWSPPKHIVLEPPPGYRVKFHQGKLYIYERDEALSRAYGL